MATWENVPQQTIFQWRKWNILGTFAAYADISFPESANSVKIDIVFERYTGTLSIQTLQREQRGSGTGIMFNISSNHRINVAAYWRSVFNWPKMDMVRCYCYIDHRKQIQVCYSLPSIHPQHLFSLFFMIQMYWLCLAFSRYINAKLFMRCGTKNRIYIDLKNLATVSKGASV